MVCVWPVRIKRDADRVTQPLPQKINSENERHATAAGDPTTKLSLFEVPHNCVGRDRTNCYDADGQILHKRKSECGDQAP